ncbi:MAG: pitrilysin family protein, partial [Bacilli bacterium]|nr:pitrilysin family protein [Bacilli bacterium]
MKYKKYSVGPYNLHIIRTDKFKSINIQVNFRRPILKEEVTIRKVLSSMLVQSTKNYPTNRLLALECEKLYGARIWCENNRIGNYSNISFNLKVLNDKYTEEGNLEKAIELFKEILFNPNIEDNKFTAKEFEIVKTDTITEIKSIKDNMTKYSLIRLLEEMDSKSPVSYRIYGYLEDLEKINTENLYSYYESVIHSDFVEVIVIGDVDLIDIKKHLTKNLKIKTIKRMKEPIYIEHDKIRKRIKKKIEQETVNQSKLSISCKLTKLTDFEKKYVFSLYSIILGGPGNSKLFNTVREKHSLAYYINSQPLSVDNLLLIYSGINKNNFSKTLRLIRKELDLMKKGDFSEEDLESAKKLIINSLESAEDSLTKLTDLYYSMELLGSDDIST